VVRDPAAIDVGRKDGHDWAMPSGGGITAPIPGEDRDRLFRYRTFGPEAGVVVPMAADGPPMLPGGRDREPRMPVGSFHQAVVTGSISMRSIVAGS
jgi:hypothetical protein